MKSLALFVILLVALSGSGSAQETTIRTFDLAMGRLELVRVEPGSYALKLSNFSRHSRIGVTHFGVSGLHAVAAAIDKAKNTARNLPVDDDTWVPVIVFEEPQLEPDTDLAVAVANTEAHGPLIALVFNLGRENQIDVASRVKSKELETVVKVFTGLMDIDEKMQRPDEVLIKGVYVPHSWRNGRAYISGADAKAFMQYAGSASEPSVDLLAAAGECGYSPVWRGTSLELRKSFEGNTYSAPATYSPFRYEPSSPSPLYSTKATSKPETRYETIPANAENYETGPSVREPSAYPTARPRQAPSDYDSGRCMATTQKGTQCKRNAQSGRAYCYQHP